MNRQSFPRLFTVVALAVSSGATPLHACDRPSSLNTVTIAAS